MEGIRLDLEWNEPIILEGRAFLPIFYSSCHSALFASIYASGKIARYAKEELCPWSLEYDYLYKLGDCGSCVLGVWMQAHWGWFCCCAV